MQIGQIIKDRYEITQLLGEGGMSYVYKATDKQLQRTVAIKTLKPNYVEQEFLLTAIIVIIEGIPAESQHIIIFIQLHMEIYFYQKN